MGGELQRLIPASVRHDYLDGCLCGADSLDPEDHDQGCTARRALEQAFAALEAPEEAVGPGGEAGAVSGPDGPLPAEPLFDAPAARKRREDFDPA